MGRKKTDTGIALSDKRTAEAAIKNLELDRMRGELIPVVWVGTFFSEAITVLLTNLAAMPAQAAARLSLDGRGKRELISVLTKLIEDIRERTATDLEKKFLAEIGKPEKLRQGVKRGRGRPRKNAVS